MWSCIYEVILTETIEQTEVHITLSYIYNLSVLIFERGGKPEYPEKNPRSAGEINYDNSTHMRRKSRPRLGLTFFSVVRGNALTALVREPQVQKYMFTYHVEGQFHFSLILYL